MNIIGVRTMEEKINLAFVTDDGYLKQTIAALVSVLDSAGNDSNFTVYLLDVGISAANIKLYQDILEQYGAKVVSIIKEIKKEAVANLKVKTHVSQAAYAKMYISDLIEADRVIYLDGDVVCLTDIKELWEEFNSAYSLCAVDNYGYQYDNEVMGLPKDTETFNSGVMVLNLKKMREKNAGEKLKTATEQFNSKTALHDQATFNYVFYNDWKKLDRKWNLQKNILLNKHKTVGMNKTEYRALVNSPAIVHFTSNSKPWLLRCAHPYRKQFQQAYIKAFSGLVYIDIGVISVAKKIKELIYYKSYKIINLF